MLPQIPVDEPVPDPQVKPGDGSILREWIQVIQLGWLFQRIAKPLRDDDAGHRPGDLHIHQCMLQGQSAVYFVSQANLGQIDLRGNLCLRHRLFLL